MSEAAAIDADAIAEIVAGLEDFVRKVPVALEERRRELFDDPRRLYDTSGAYSTEVADLMTEVRQRSAEAGYYSLFAPEEIGGAGLDTRALLQVWEALYRTNGPRSLLAYEAIAHWATGPGPILLHLGTEERGKVLAPIMSGEKTFCFGMSEPDAGSDPWAMRTTAVRTRAAG